MSRPCRSVLYIPGSRERALEKACTLPADAIIFDLEDAVGPEEKPAARVLLARVLRDFDYGARLRIVRINGFDTEWGRDDAAAMAAAVAVTLGNEQVSTRSATPMAAKSPRVPALVAWTMVRPARSWSRTSVGELPKSKPSGRRQLRSPMTR